MARYTRRIQDVCRYEMKKSGLSHWVIVQNWRILRHERSEFGEGGVSVSVRREHLWMDRRHRSIQLDEQQALTQALHDSPFFQTMLAMRDELVRMWTVVDRSKDQLVHDLRQWCLRAEYSGIEPLRAFSFELRTIHVAPAP